jgi:hypothetical protein
MDGGYSFLGSRKMLTARCKSAQEDKVHALRELQRVAGGLTAPNVSVRAGHVICVGKSGRSL